MDNRLRRNEICVIGLPRCDFVFASTRSCFIAYGFVTSSLEMTILKGILTTRGLEPIEAGGMRAPGESAFCVKICSKIITSQFCIALLNNDHQDGRQVPNANVNMEYGLMLGFNKYVIPFQRAEQHLPFNVAGLDTIKYTNETFPALAEAAIDQAIAKTTPATSQAVDVNERIFTYLLTNEAVMARIDTEGDRAIFDLGNPLGFNLLTDFTGTKYSFLGNFPHLRPEAVLWRLRMLCHAIDKRRSSWAERVALGVMNETQARAIEEIFSRFQVWLIVTSADNRRAVEIGLAEDPPTYATAVRSLQDIETDLQSLGGALA